MQNDRTFRLALPFFKRVLDLWPYLLIAISVGGFAYIALNNMQ